MASQHFKLQNLNCPSCITHLEAMEDDVVGVSQVDASYKQQSMKVEYDDTAQTTAGIVKAVAALGYVAIPYEGPSTNISAENPLWKRLFR